MGYEVEVSGQITFSDIEGFKHNFPFEQERESEVGMHNDWAYFFTKVWGNNLSGLKETNGATFRFYREGKNWYNLQRALEYLSKYASFVLEFQGEDMSDHYKYTGKDNHITYMHAFDNEVD